MGKHLCGIHKYLLLCQHNFAWALIESIKQEINKIEEKINFSNQKISEDFLLHVLDTALQNGKEKHDPQFVLTAVGLQLEIGLKTRNLFETFRPTYNIPNGMRSFFSQKIMTSYGQVSRLLWKLKWIEYSLMEKWIELNPIFLLTKLFQGTDFDKLLCN